MFEGGDAGDWEGGSILRQTEKPIAVPITVEPTEAPDRTKPKSGWSTENATPASKAVAESTVEGYTEESGAKPKRPEEDEDEALVQEVAAPPKPEFKPIASVRELERNAQFALPPVPDPGIDLSVLSSFLRPSGLVSERDETWNPDALFAQLVTEILAEQEEEELKREIREAQEAEILKRQQQQSSSNSQQSHSSTSPPVVATASIAGTGVSAKI